jgi:hypothetical protein
MEIEQCIVTFTDSLGHGLIGVVGGDTNNSAEVAFSNAKVWKL